MTKKSPWLASRKVEKQYERQLRRVAHEVGRIVEGYDPTIAADLAQLQADLRKYSDLLRPWAKRTAQRVVEAIDQQDRAAWWKRGDELSRNLRVEIEGAPTGDILRAFLEENVGLITSIPIEAGQRAHRLVVNAMVAGNERAREIASEIARTSEVTKSRATLIARTEVARTSSGLTQARAEHIGSTHYIWRTARDGDVRHSHRLMEGKVIAWAEAPTLSDGTTTHAGQIYNCRCWPEPIVAEESGAE